MSTLSRLPSHTAYHLAPALKFSLPLEPSYPQLPCPDRKSCPPLLFSAAPSALRASPSLLLHHSRSYQVPSISTHLLCSTTRSGSQDLLFDTWYMHYSVELQNFRVGYSFTHHLLQHPSVLQFKNPKCRLRFPNPQTRDLALSHAN